MTSGLAVGKFLLFFRGEGVVVCCEADANEEDIALAEFDVLFGDNSVDVRHFYGVGLKWGEGDVVALGPGVPVYKNTTTDDAAVVGIGCEHTVRQRLLMDSC